jgi:asparaginyl-tRNA synthetase
LTEQSYVKIIGKITPIPADKKSMLPVEMHSTKLEILSRADPLYSSECPRDAAPQLKLEKRHLHVRSMAPELLAKAILVTAIRAHFAETECIETFCPTFMGIQSEGGATLFSVQHPGKSMDKPQTVYLTQSSQFYLEKMVPAIGDCYTIDKSYRAESSHTRRHLTEFLHAESEYGGILTFEDHLDKLRDLLQGIAKHFLLMGRDLLTQLGKLEHVQKFYEQTKDIMILEHVDAIKECRRLEIYKDAVTKTHFDDRDDIPEAQERELIDRIGKIVFLTKFPKEFKSFYMALDPKDPSRVLGCDVEVPGVGEIIGSGVRESDLAIITERLIASGENPADYTEYLDLRKYGHGKTSGMGLGVDRLLTYLLGAFSIREVVAFPRFPGYVRP